MNLAAAPAAYDRADQARVRQALQTADAENFKKRRDVELANGERLILESPDGSRWGVQVDNAGALSTTGPL